MTKLKPSGLLCDSPICPSLINGVLDLTVKGFMTDNQACTVSVTVVKIRKTHGKLKLKAWHTKTISTNKISNNKTEIV